MSDTDTVLKQLNDARTFALGQPALYPQIVPTVLQVCGAEANLELRRWGSSFLAEALASPVVRGEDKQSSGVLALDTLKGYLDKPDEDTAVTKNAVQAAASVYPYIFRHIITTPTDGATWQKMAGIKSSILRRMDTAASGVRICCIKFVQTVVQVQTPGMIVDPRHQNQNEISLALVPRDHPVIPPSNLEAEASGLLDRLLGVLQDNSSDPLIVTATLNSLGSLVRSRASISAKIINTTLNFNPLMLANSPMTTKDKVALRSIVRTTMCFLVNILKRQPPHPMAGRIDQHVQRLKHSLVEAFDETRRKRPAPAEPTDGLSDSKRQRLGAEVPGSASQSQAFPPLPPGPVSVAQLFTLVRDPVIAGIDAKVISIDLVTQILPPLLQSLDRGKFDNAINAVRARYLSLTKSKPADALAAAKIATGGVSSAGDDDDDYEPEYPGEDTEQIMNDLDQAPTEDRGLMQTSDMSLGPFNLPAPPPLSEEQTVEYSKGAVQRMFGTLSYLDSSTPLKAVKHGFNRLAATNNDKDAWITVLTRLATRASAGLEGGAIKPESENRGLAYRNFSFSDQIRESLFQYVIQDFRRRIDVAISWLNEEWYNDRIQTKERQGSEQPITYYEKWMFKILDGIVPFLDAKDKVLIRFLSEIPSVNRDVLQRVTRLARDPERVQLAVISIQYLILYRPPVREMCIDAAEDLYRNYEDAKSAAGKLLAKWRPQAVQGAQTNGAT